MKKKVPEGHECDRGDINWNKKPTLGMDDNILWHGKCSVCGKRVYEVYEYQEALYDAETHETIYP